MGGMTYQRRACRIAASIGFWCSAAQVVALLVFVTVEVAVVAYRHFNQPKLEG